MRNYAHSIVMKQYPISALVLGSLSLEHALFVDRIPREDEDATVIREVQFPGGAAANVAAMLSLLGCKTSLLTKVGRDQLGNKLLRDIQSYGVLTSQIYRTKRSTTQFTVISDSLGHRCFLLNPAHASFHLTEHEVFRARWPSSGVICLVGLPWRLTKAALNRAAAAKTSVALNLGFLIAAGDLRGAWMGHVAKADFIFLNRAEWEILTRSNQKKLLSISKGSTTSLVVTDGAKSATFRLGNSSYAVAPPKRLEVSNSLGCGDAFMAGCVAALHLKLEPPDALLAGHLCAAAVAALPVERSNKINLASVKQLFRSRILQRLRDESRST